MLRHVRFCLVLAVIQLGLLAPLRAQPTLPVVDEVDFEPLRAQCQRLMRALEVAKAPLPADVTKELTSLLRDGNKDPATTAARIQELLDPRCLIGVSINPESRVKAARGPAAAELRRDREVILLVKVHNEAGTTHALTVSGPQVRHADRKDRDRWLEARIVADRPLSKTLTGQKLEYMLLRLTAREAGRREATLRFDAGQGTQDLGFRAEVPVLFTIR
jgi:hypothetical protein